MHRVGTSICQSKSFSLPKDTGEAFERFSGERCYDQICVLKKLIVDCHVESRHEGREG